MTLRILFLLSLLASTVLGLKAQEDTEARPQIVELKDGSRLLGTIISDTDYAVQLVILTGDTLEIGYKYISSVGDTEDLRIRRVSSKRVRPPKKHISKSLVTELSIGGSLQGDDGAAGLIVNASITKMLNDKVGVGVGAGYMTYSKFVSFYPISSGFVPIYVSSKYVLSETNDIKPFVQLAAGYGVGINKQRFEFQSQYFTENGLFGQMQVGTSISNRGNYNLTVALNLNVQSTKGNLSGLDWNSNLPFSSSFELVMIRPGFSIGLMF